MEWPEVHSTQKLGHSVYLFGAASQASEVKQAQTNMLGMAIISGLGTFHCDTACQAVGQKYHLALVANSSMRSGCG